MSNVVWLKTQKPRPTLTVPGNQEYCELVDSVSSALVRMEENFVRQVHEAQECESTLEDDLFTAADPQGAIGQCHIDQLMFDVMEELAARWQRKLANQRS